MCYVISDVTDIFVANLNAIAPTLFKTVLISVLLNFMMTSSNGNIFRLTGPLCGEFTKGQWSGALMFSLICAWTNGWVNNRDAGDLRRHRAHYDVTEMCRNTGNTVTLGFQYPTYLNTIITVTVITGGIMTSVIYHFTPIARISCKAI